jgi:hypothetical protein
MKYLSHATNRDNFDNILANDLKVGIDGVVYLADSKENALKFMAFRPYKEVVVFQIDVEQLDQDKLRESFDHNEGFFKCKAWMYTDDIGSYAFTRYYEFENKLFKD